MKKQVEKDECARCGHTPGVHNRYGLSGCREFRCGCPSYLSSTEYPQKYSAPDGWEHLDVCDVPTRENCDGWLDPERLWGRRDWTTNCLGAYSGDRDGRRWLLRRAESLKPLPVEPVVKDQPPVTRDEAWSGHMWVLTEKPGKPDQWLYSFLYKQPALFESRRSATDYQKLFGLSDQRPLKVLVTIQAVKGKK